MTYTDEERTRLHAAMNEAVDKLGRALAVTQDLYGDVDDLDNNEQPEGWVQLYESANDCYWLMAGYLAQRNVAMPEETQP